jgi:hypothetical protein
MRYNWPILNLNMAKSGCSRPKNHYSCVTGM